MNKDKIIMVALLIGTFMFFRSDLWNSIGSKIKPAPETTTASADSTTVVDSTGETVADSETEHTPALLSSAPAKLETPKLPGEESDVEETTVSKSTIDSTATESIITPDTTVIENNLLKLTIAGDGARIISAKVKGYNYAEKLNFGDDEVELIQNRDQGIAGSAIQNKSLNNIAFTYTGEEDGRHTFQGIYKGETVQKTFSLQDSSYIVGYELTSDLLSDKSSSILVASGITESETKDGRGLRYSPRELSLYDGKKIYKKRLNKEKAEQEEDKYTWAALSSSYFTIAVLPSTLQNSRVDFLAAKVLPNEKSNPQNLLYSFSMTAISTGTKSNYDLYLGPKNVKELKKVQVGLEKTVFRGFWWFFGANLWFPKLCEFVLWMMNIFFFIFKDYGIAIILITLILRAITFPLTQSSMKSMSKMRDMQPKMQAIQTKYKNNPQLMQAKMMEMYKEEGVNPLASLGGCLPMIMQMPIMISLYAVVRKAVQLRGQDTFILPWVSDLSQKESLFDLPFRIPLPMDAEINTFALLPFAMAGLMFVQNKMTMAKTPTNNQDPQVASQQRMMLYMMPIMMFFMFYNMPAGLTLYFTFSSVLQIVQQHFVDKAKKKNESSVSVVK